MNRSFWLHWSALFAEAIARIFAMLAVCAPLMAEDRWLMVGDAAKSGTDFSFTATEAPLLTKGTLFFTASWCPPCKRVKAESFTTLREAGWKIGDDTSGHIQVIDVDEHPELKDAFGIESLPAWVRIKDGSVIAQRSGFMDGRTAGYWMRGEAATDTRSQTQQPQFSMPVRQRSFLFWSWSE